MLFRSNDREEEPDEADAALGRIHGGNRRQGNEQPKGRSEDATLGPEPWRRGLTHPDQEERPRQDADPNAKVERHSSGEWRLEGPGNPAENCDDKKERRRCQQQVPEAEKELSALAGARNAELGALAKMESKQGESGICPT